MVSISTRTAPVAHMESTACQTVYVSHLNDRVSATDLTSLLYELFSSYGEVIAVQILKHKGIRGTAFVSLKSVAQATMAVRNLKGMNVLGKEIQVQFAKKRSDEVSKIAGTFKPKFRPARRKGAFTEDMAEE